MEYSDVFKLLASRWGDVDLMIELAYTNEAEQFNPSVEELEKCPILAGIRQTLEQSKEH